MGLDGISREGASHAPLSERFENVHPRAAIRLRELGEFLRHCPTEPDQHVTVGRVDTIEERSEVITDVLGLGGFKVEGARKTALALRSELAILVAKRRDAKALCEAASPRTLLTRCLVVRARDDVMEVVEQFETVGGLHAKPYDYILVGECHHGTVHEVGDHASHDGVSTR